MGRDAIRAKYREQVRVDPAVLLQTAKYVVADIVRVTEFGEQLINGPGTEPI
jgi:hypothetical protein